MLAFQLWQCKIHFTVGSDTGVLAPTTSCGSIQSNGVSAQDKRFGLLPENGKSALPPNKLYLLEDTVV